MSAILGKNGLRGSLMAGALVVGLVGAGTVVGYSFAQGFAPSGPPLELKLPVRQEGFAELVRTVKPAVVSISTEEAVKASPLADNPDLDQFLNQFWGSGWRGMMQQSERPTHALGSGFIVDPAGYIVTNNHVIDDATDIEVSLADGSTHRAHVVGRDQKTDIALLKIDAGRRLPYVAFGNSDRVEVGDWVVAMGNPYGLGGSVSAGIVSGEKRNINAGPYDQFLQVDAPINPGNSGGPLFDESGHVIGIDTAIFTPSGGSVGIGFAIPSNVASNVVADLREHGHVARGWLGVQMQNLTPALARAVGLPNQNGVLVDIVTPDSPAERAGFHQGDVITAFDGKPIHSPSDLAFAVAAIPAGRTVPTTVWRDGHNVQMRVTIGSQQEMRTASAEVPRGPRVGLELAPLSPEQSAQSNVSGGALVERVMPGSQADLSGIEPGDVIVRVGNDNVHSPADVASDLKRAEAEHRRALPLLIERNNVSQYLALNLKAG